MSSTDAVQAHLVAALQGTALFTAAQVVRGRHSEAPDFPFCCVSFEGFRTERAGAGARVALGQYYRTLQFVVAAWVEVGSDDPSTREAQTLTHLDTILQALELDRTAGGNCQDLMTQGDAFLAVDPDTGQNVAFVGVIVEAYVHLIRGL